MDRRRYYEFSQVVNILREAEVPENSISSLCYRHGISERTLLRWKEQYPNASIELLSKLVVRGA